MHEAIAREGDWRSAPFLPPVGPSSAALLLGGRVLSVGEIPGTVELHEIGAWPDTTRREELVATASLSLDEPAFEPLRATASRPLAVVVSSLPDERLSWFGPKGVSIGGGAPFKPVGRGRQPGRSLAPPLVRHVAPARSGNDRSVGPAGLATARLIGDTLPDLVLPFRPVRLLIAQDRLDQIGRQLDMAEQPVPIASARGRILMANRGLNALFDSRCPAPHRLDQRPARGCTNSSRNATAGASRSNSRTRTTNGSSFRSGRIRS